VTGAQLFELFEARLGDLVLLEMSAHSSPRTELVALPDEELMESVRHRQNVDYVVVNVRTGKLHDGDGRVIELQRRAQNPMSTITFDSLVPVEHYLLDLSMFPDLNA
jgi:hypothetical protein